MEIKDDAEKNLNEVSKTLESIPDLEETYYITDNLNLTRKDEAVQKDSSKILRNAKTDKNGNLIVKKAVWTQ